jgi:glycosyltransferase involved in cell wall biosynthesis
MLKLDLEGSTKQADERSIAILVLTYNHEDFIEQCLLSLQNMMCPNRHIWVLDDGSTDHTAEIVRRVGGQQPGLTLLTQKNSGGRTSLNLQRLLDCSSGKYVMFMSGDDLLGSGFSLEPIIDYLEKNKDVGMIIPRALVMDSNPLNSVDPLYDEQLLRLLEKGDPKEVFDFYLNKRVSSIFIQGMIIRRDLLDSVGGFDVDFTADDYALICKLFSGMPQLGFKFEFFKQYFWLYRLHRHNIHRNPLRQLRAISEVVGRYIAAKHWADFEWHIMPLRSVGDVCEAEIILAGNLDKITAKKIMNRIMVKTYSSWLEGGNFREIKRSFFRSAMPIWNRVNEIYCLMRAFPLTCVAMFLGISGVYRVLSVLTRAAQRRA